jgi:hypothetical protein
LERGTPGSAGLPKDVDRGTRGAASVVRFVELTAFVAHHAVLVCAALDQLANGDDALPHVSLANQREVPNC